MGPERPCLEEWRALYEAAVRFRDLEPWNWMYEDHMFGVVNPEDGQIGYCSVMGALGEHLALAVYLGAEGFYTFYRMREQGEADELDVFDLFIQQRALQASFGGRGELSDEDRQVIRDLGLKFRGRQAWPLFQDYAPGYFPWHVNAGQARFLTMALEQAHEVATRFRDDPDALYEFLDSWECLVRIFRQDEGSGTWVDERRPLPREAVLPGLGVDFDQADLEALGRVGGEKERGGAWELDYFYYPQPIQEQRGDRPYYPQAVMIVGHGSGLIFGTDLAEPGTLGETICRHVLGTLRAMPFWPEQIGVRREDLADLLFPLTKALEIELWKMEELPALTEARMEMARFLR